MPNTQLRPQNSVITDSRSVKLCEKKTTFLGLLGRVISYNYYKVIRILKCFLFHRGVMVALLLFILSFCGQVVINEVH